MKNENVNVGDTERVLSGVMGGALLLKALRQRAPWGIVGAIVGCAGVYRAVSGKCQVYKALGISTTPHTAEVKQGFRIVKTTVIQQPPEAVFRFWRKLENLPLFMSHLISVIELTPKDSRWTAKGPAGKQLHWNAEILNETENEWLAWHSIGDGDLRTTGSIAFEATPDNGTKVTLNLQYLPSLGRVGNTAALLMGNDPAQSIDSDLQRFKEALESGASA